jgi:hypothetical protein
MKNLLAITTSLISNYDLINYLQTTQLFCSVEVKLFLWLSFFFKCLYDAMLLSDYVHYKKQLTVFFCLLAHFQQVKFCGNH